MEKANKNVERAEIILLKELNLFVNKDENAATVFFICIKHHSSTRDIDFTSKCNIVFACYWLAFDSSNNFLLVLIELTEFSYI